jgi:outer membrane protein assembly factor BamD
MNHRFALSFTVLCLLLACPFRAPAPLIYRPDEGWTYEKPGEDKGWQKNRAREQFQVAEEAFARSKYDLAGKAAKRLVTRWPMSDYAPQAQYLLGRCYEAEGKDEVAFKHYQTLLQKYPKMTNAQEVLERQFIIANKFLGGSWRKLFGTIPVPPSTDKTIEMYEKIIKNAPYSDVAPQAQINIGVAREKQGDYNKAVKAYDSAADKYADREAPAADALYKAGLANLKQSKKADYDQNAANDAISSFSDFTALHPKDQRVPEAQKKIDELKTEQARGSFEIAKYYEEKKKWTAALIYYGDVLVKDPSSKYASQARQRIAELKKRIEGK